jgi:hypothetical protein
MKLAFKIITSLVLLAVIGFLSVILSEYGPIVIGFWYILCFLIGMVGWHFIQTLSDEFFN